MAAAVSTVQYTVRTGAGDFIEVSTPATLHFPPPSRVRNSSSSLHLFLTLPSDPWMRGHMHSAPYNIICTRSSLSNRTLRRPSAEL